jgi:hypothetical protein
VYNSESYGNNNTFKNRPTTATQSTNKYRALSATSKPVRNINSSKPLSNKKAIDYPDWEFDKLNTNSNNNELFDEPNFQEN